LKDANIRWVVATALGLAAATLAGLWGQSFANGKQPAESAPLGSATTGPGNTSNKISGGRFYGMLFQGRDFNGTPKNPKSKSRD